ncbi:conserved hypothetical protein [Leishmania braziliensis MHOM/BR/75/M2904]|uniref:Trypanosoma Tc-38 (p38) protein domain-containing protein n=1 Tax=Leishmania braziliensis TaxID=5660 RepID=A4H3R5_LEIBR|nr:conserved hypothetical protein [Leishmania braziliensis MHOM/BR/75/M2904]CAJ2476774.1 unnamed protein product [Leishmania braziliensis]CAM36830.2 conserved hypothetical protein [Leishmania braziliensis MHOM/BR/75/M2904]
MPNIPASLLNDVLGRPSPWWLSRLSAEARGALSGVELLATTAQKIQLGRQIYGDGRSATESFCLRDAHGGFDMRIAEAQVILTHGRRLRQFSLNRGDVPLHVDLSDFLSCSGSSVTQVAEEAESLAERTRRNSYASPFWFTKEQLEGHFWNSCTQHTTRCAPKSRKRVCEVYENPNMFVELGCGAGKTAPYANLDEFRSQPNAELSLFSCISFLRIFSPISVKTQRAFDACVEWRLRVECQQSGCWCSVWGSAEDYASCGFSILDGAIGVDMFDALGNPLFLVNALCTTAPLAVYASCYPSDSIINSDVD